jgi:hypothetical protein
MCNVLSECAEAKPVGSLLELARNLRFKATQAIEDAKVVEDAERYRREGSKNATGP